MEPNPEQLHADALERLDSIKAQWVEAGSPLLANGSTGQLVEHPLVKMLREHEVLVARLAGDVRRKNRGPAPSAVLGGVPASGSAKLRLAKASERKSA